MPYIMYIEDPTEQADSFNTFETKEQLLAKVRYLLEHKLQEPKDLVIFETTTATALSLSTELIVRLSDTPKLPPPSNPQKE